VNVACCLRAVCPTSARTRWCHLHLRRSSAMTKRIGACSEAARSAHIQRLREIHRASVGDTMSVRARFTSAKCRQPWLLTLLGRPRPGRASGIDSAGVQVRNGYKFVFASGTCRLNCLSRTWPAPYPCQWLGLGIVGAGISQRGLEQPGSIFATTCPFFTVELKSAWSSELSRTPGCQPAR